MAEDTTINGLSTALAATAAADDLLPIWDTSAAAMKKHAAAYVARSDGASGHKLITGSGRELTVPATGTAALLAAAQSFTALQTFSAYLSSREIVPVAGISKAVGSYYLADWIPDVNGFGLLVVFDDTNGNVGGFVLRGGAGQVLEAFDPGNKFSVTSGTATSINVHYTASVYQIENNTGGTALIRVLLLGT